jgi:hypothetical protein
MRNKEGLILGLLCFEKRRHLHETKGDMGMKYPECCWLNMMKYLRIGKTEESDKVWTEAAVIINNCKQREFI